MGKTSPQNWSGWSAALSKCLKDAGGELDWRELQTQLVSTYTKDVGSIAKGDEELVRNAALVCIPESYLSKEDSLVRLPKKRAAADSEDAPTAKKSKKEANEDSEMKETKTEAGEVALKVFVKGLPYSVDEATLKKDFSECGEIERMQFPLNEEGKPKGFAFITYTSKEGVDAALKFDNTDYGGRFINVSIANDNFGKGKDGKGKGKDGKGKDGKGGGKGKDGPDNENTVFIRGLPFSTTEEALRKDFAECGEIVSLKLPLNEEGKLKGIAFIKYASAEGLDAAIKFDNTDYGGRTINVAKAGEGKGKGKDGKGKDGKGKGKDGKDKGKGKKGKGKGPSEAFAKNTGAIVASTGEKKTFDDDSDSE